MSLGGGQFSAQNSGFSPKRWSPFLKKITARSLVSRKIIIVWNVSLHNLVSKKMFLNFMHTHVAHFLAYGIFFWKKKSKFLQILWKCSLCLLCAHQAHIFFENYEEKIYLKTFVIPLLLYFQHCSPLGGKKTAGTPKIGVFQKYWANPHFFCQKMRNFGWSLKRCCKMCVQHVRWSHKFWEIFFMM